MNISKIKVRIARIYLFTLCARTLESLQVKSAMRTSPYAIRDSAPLPPCEPPSQLPLFTTGRSQ